MGERWVFSTGIKKKTTCEALFEEGSLLGELVE